PSGFAFLRSCSEPFDGLAHVFAHTFGEPVMATQVNHCFRMPVFRREAIPLHGFDMTLQNAIPILVDKTQSGLGVGKATFRSRAKVTERLLDITLDSSSSQVEPGEIIG